MPTPLWPPRGYVTLPQAAQDLGISRARIYQLVAAQQIETHATDRGQLLAAADVRRLRGRSTQAGPPKGSQNARRYPRKARKT